MERAQQVLATGEALAVEYDTRGSDDVLWGIGLGCEGAMRIVLTRIDPANGYQPFAQVTQSRERNLPARFALVTASDNPAFSFGRHYLGSEPDLPAPVLHTLNAPESGPRALSNTAIQLEHAGATFLIVSIALPVQLLILGAGPDVIPIVELAGMLDWQTCVVDHRPAYARPERFPRAARVLSQPVERLGDIIATARFDAAVVMSHHLLSDAAYLAALARSDIPYIGLLGPAPRRARLLSELDAQQAEALGWRLRGPVGLDIGASTPETIALSIVSEIQAVLAGRSGQPFSATVRT